jgi:hypothetical protein
MNKRVMHRPMFRKGGSASEGITSGLAPRQGYADKGWVQQVLPTEKEISTLQKMYGERPRSTNLNDFLISFGLDLASRSPQGNIFQTAAMSAQKPFDRFQERKMYEQAQPRQERADIINTIISGKAAALSGEGGRDAFSHEAKQENIAKLMRKSFNLEQTDISTMTPDELNKHNLEKNIIEKQLRDYIGENPVVEYYFQDKEGTRIILDEFRKKLAESPKEIDTDGDGEVDMTQSQYYTENPLELEKEVFKMFNEYYEDISKRKTKALGGIMEKETETIKTPDATMQMSEEVEEAPETLSYEELRRRLPPEVTDDVVVLLSQSGEALTDFAEIQTQVDVDNFNAKYGVNLVLPSEA